MSDILIKQPGLIDIIEDTESIYRFKNKTNLNKEIKKNINISNNFEEKKK
jgi:hypothetical protein